MLLLAVAKVAVFTSMTDSTGLLQLCTPLPSVFAVLYPPKGLT